MFKLLKELFSEDSPATLQESSETTKNNSSDLIEKEIYETITNANQYLINVEKMRESTLKSTQIKAPNIDENLLKTLKRLEELGFTNQKEVADMRKVLNQYNEDLKEYNKKKKDNEDQLKLLNYYKLKYPNNKFIDPSILLDLNKRFGLITAPIKFYIAEIPDKNKKEILNFNCDAIDKRRRYSIRAINLDKSTLLRAFPDLNLDNFRWSLIERLNFERYLSDKEVKHLVDNVFYNYRRHAVGPWTHSIRNDSYVEFNLAENYHAQKIGFEALTDALIIAPPHKFNLTEEYMIEKGLAVSKMKIKIKDPVVLQPVEGGYLIVSHWGFESTLPEIAGEPNVGIHNSMN
jgi:hypothetical protein